MCGGVILRCLSTQLEQITSDACAKEVRYFQMMETNDFNNDVIMAAACRKDVETYCANVTAGGWASSGACGWDPAMVRCTPRGTLSQWA